MSKPPLIITVSNGKGGVGKTTYCMHLISAFLGSGFKVLSVDLDEKQRSLSLYLDNRRKYKEANPSEKILLPDHYLLVESKKDKVGDVKQEELESLTKAIASSQADIILIDTPGDFSHRSVLGARFANIMITPINDSFVDLSVLCKIGPDLKIQGPSAYSNIVWQQKIERAKNRDKSFEWFVVRNRVNNTDTLNKRKMVKAVGELSHQLGFKIASGFSDRVIFKDLFLHGLTLSDVGQASSIKSFTPNNLAARSELRAFLSSFTNLIVKDLKQR